jgi:hypothetical protein
LTLWRDLLLGDAAFVGSRRGIVYVGCSKEARIAYVGQTAGSGGVLGRWSHHLSSVASSFWRRVEERGECDPQAVSDLAIFAAELGPETYWNGIESSYREAVEYLVQARLWAVCGDLVPYLRIISEVRANDTCELDFVRERAAAIFREFLSWYSN